MEIKLGKHTIGTSSPVYFIADIASNHNGDLQKAKELIHACAESGVNAIKMQNFQAHSIVSDEGFKNLKGVKTHQSKWETSVYDSYHAASIPLDWTLTLKELAESLHMDYFTSPYSRELTKAVAPHVSAFKLGSGDITWHDHIAYMAGFGKPLLIATGASTLEEVKMAVEVAQQHTSDILLMQCNTNYTATHGEEVEKTIDRFANINLKVLATYAELWPTMLLGLSDHTHGSLTVLAAVGLYNCVAVEKHFTLDSTQKGQDHSFSMMPKEWLKMVNQTKMLKENSTPQDDFSKRYQLVKEIAEDAQYLDVVLGDGVKKLSENEKNTVIVQRRAIRATENLPPGHILTQADLNFLRPCPLDALPPYQVETILGKKLANKVSKGDYIKITDVEK